MFSSEFLVRSSSFRVRLHGEPEHEPSSENGEV